MDILLEGKKEIIEKTKKKHSTNGEFIDRMFSIDPTSQGKYAEWISNYLDSSLKFKDYDKIEDMITKIIIPFEKNYKRIDDDIVKQFEKKLIDSGVNLEGKNLIDVEKIKKTPKDINSYSIPFYLLAMIQVLEETKSRSEEERIAKKGAYKVFGDSNYLVVRPLTWESSCFYGFETKWCTAMKNDRYHYDKHTRDGILYYFIDKKNKGNKVALYLEKDGKKLKKYVFDSLDKERGVDFLYEKFPKLTSLISELTEELPIVDLLRGYLSGKDTSNQILSSDIVSYFEKNEENRGESIVEISFDGLDDYKKVFDLSDDDKWFLGIIDSTYNDYDFYPMDIDSEWGEGYIIDKFNDENTKLLREILKYILPTYVNTDLSDDYEVKSTIAKTLKDMFDREASDISYEYQSEMNRATEIGTRNTIESELCDYFEKYGFKKSSKNCFDEYQTTINNLIKLFEEHQPEKNTIESLLYRITEDDSVGGWSENSYEMIDWEAFDEEGFQRNVNWNLEKILDQIQENENFPQYKELFDGVTEKYEIEKWYNLPRNKDFDFKITGIDMDDLTISVMLRNENNYGISKYILNDVDEFYSFLYNYKLFDDN
jgi:hypothetical protein